MNDMKMKLAEAVSILVLMDLCIKTEKSGYYNVVSALVSILVLMDLCIKTFPNPKE